VIALDKKTGETVWRTNRSIDFQDLGPDGKPEADGDFRKAYSTPLITRFGGRRIMISLGSKATYAYDPVDGRELWRVEERNSHSGTTRPVVGHGLIFICSGFPRGQLMAIRPGGSGTQTEPEVVWNQTRNVPEKPSLLLVDDLIYMVDDGGIASCLEAQSGEFVWQNRIGGNYSASPVYAAGRLYFFNEEGKTTVIAPGREFNLLAENHLDDGFMASPAVVGKALILRTKTHLYRIEKSGP
jgi:outer membrane protein assembly factor BamB